MRTHANGCPPRHARRARDVRAKRRGFGLAERPYLSNGLVNFWLSIQKCSLVALLGPRPDISLESANDPNLASTWLIISTSRSLPAMFLHFTWPPPVARFERCSRIKGNWGLGWSKYRRRCCALALDVRAGREYWRRKAWRLGPHALASHAGLVSLGNFGGGRFLPTLRETTR
jgi:hypothetical protein